MNAKNTRTLISLGLVALLMLIYSLTAKNFLTWTNMSLLLKDSAYTGILALGVAFVIIGGGVDLSVGGIVCVSAMITAHAAFVGLPGIVCFLISVLVGGLCGLINGFIVTRLHVSEFVTTLATGFIYSGLGLVFSFRDNGRLTAQYLTNDSFNVFGLDVGGIFYITIAFFVLTAVLFILQSRFKFGLYTYAIGSSPKSAKMSGVNNDTVKLLGFLISGLCAGIAAAFICSIQSSATISLGKGMEFMAIAACVVGGVALGGGRGDALGALLGAIFMTVIWNGLYKYGITTAWQYVLQCVIIIFATTFDAQFNRMNDKRLRALAEKEAS
jgi:ribose transport system permease protein